MAAVSANRFFRLNEQSTPAVSTQASPGYPPIDHDHIIKAEFNSQGKPTGGHSLVNNDVRITQGTETPPNPHGVYEAQVEMQNASGGWEPKLSNGGWNTMSPKDWTAEKIKAEVESAWKNPNRVVSSNGRKWRSISPSGVVVEGYINPHGVTAYPIY